LQSDPRIALHISAVALREAAYSAAWRNAGNTGRRVRAGASSGPTTSAAG
jgi:hypothetical protein